jgi:hypothetical protein
MGTTKERRSHAHIPHVPAVIKTTFNSFLGVSSFNRRNAQRHYRETTAI